MRISKESK